MKEDNVPLSKWCMARVVEVLPGKNGLVRAARVKTKDGFYVRPITKLCMLPNDT